MINSRKNILLFEQKDTREKCIRIEKVTLDRDMLMNLEIVIRVNYR